MPSIPSTSSNALEPVERLALAYAARQARPAWEALLLFQHRLADVARPGREPLMIQLRLSWWRDRLSEPAARWPKGEPLLVRLAIWEPEAPALIGLVDGWEAKIVGEDGGASLMQAQVEAYAALARLVGESDETAVRLSAQQMLGPTSHQQKPPRLTRAMRPLSVLRAHALLEAQGAVSRPLANFTSLLRIGLLGR